MSKNRKQRIVKLKKSKGTSSKDNTVNSGLSSHGRVYIKPKSKLEYLIESNKSKLDNQTARLDKIKVIDNRKFNWFCLALLLISTATFIIAQIPVLPYEIVVAFTVVFGISLFLSMLVPITRVFFVKKTSALNEANN